MILSAQRVLSSHGIAGINTYVYRHPEGAWFPADLEILEGTATLVQQDLEVPPGGNAVRSYLDLFAAEGTDSSVFVAWAQEVRMGPDPVSFPVEIRKGDMMLRFGLVHGLVTTWRREFTDLATRILLLVGATPCPPVPQA